MPRLLTVTAISIIACTLTMACKKEESKQPQRRAANTGDIQQEQQQQQGTPGGATSGGFLTNADIAKPANLTTLSVEEMLHHMSSSMIVYLNPPDDPAPDDAFGACVDRKMAPVAIKASKTTLTLEGSVDYSDCPFEYGSTELAKIKFMIGITCEGGDLSSFNGKTIGSIGAKDINKILALEKVCPSSSGTLTSQSLSEMSANINYENQTLPMNSRSVNAMTTATLAPCRFSWQNGRLKIEDGCQFIDKGEAKNNGEVINTYVIGKYRNLHGEPGGTYYSSGSMDLEINHWQGRLQFSGRESPPSYRMSSQGQVKEGVYAGYDKFGLVSALSLTPVMPRLFVKP